MKTTELESRKSESQDPKSAARREESTPSEDDLDPDFPIAGAGGPSEDGGNPNTRPIEPPKTK